MMRLFCDGFLHDVPATPMTLITFKTLNPFPFEN